MTTPTIPPNSPSSSVSNMGQVPTASALPPTETTTSGKSAANLLTMSAATIYVAQSILRLTRVRTFPASAAKLNTRCRVVVTKTKNALSNVRSRQAIARGVASTKSAVKATFTRVTTRAKDLAASASRIPSSVVALARPPKVLHTPKATKAVSPANTGLDTIVETSILNSKQTVVQVATSPVAKPDTQAVQAVVATPSNSAVTKPVSTEESDRARFEKHAKTVEMLGNLLFILTVAGSGYYMSQDTADHDSLQQEKEKTIDLYHAKRAAMAESVNDQVKLDQQMKEKIIALIDKLPPEEQNDFLRILAETGKAITKLEDRLISLLSQSEGIKKETSAMHDAIPHLARGIVELGVFISLGRLKAANNLRVALGEKFGFSKDFVDRVLYGTIMTAAGEFTHYALNKTASPEDVVKVGNAMLAELGIDPSKMSSLALKEHELVSHASNALGRGLGRTLSIFIKAKPQVQLLAEISVRAPLKVAHSEQNPQVLSKDRVVTMFKDRFETPLMEALQEQEEGLKAARRAMSRDLNTIHDIVQAKLGLHLQRRAVSAVKAKFRDAPPQGAALIPSSTYKNRFHVIGFAGAYLQNASAAGVIFKRAVVPPTTLNSG